MDDYLSGAALRTIDLPILQLVRRFRTDGYFMYPPCDPNNPGTQYTLTTANFAFITPMEETIIVVNGAMPQPFVSLLREGDAIEAMASESLANEFGVQVGDTYSLRTEKGQIPVSIVGLWRAVDPTAPYWDVKDESLLFVHEETYKGIISDRVGDELRNATWRLSPMAHPCMQTMWPHSKSTSMTIENPSQYTSSQYRVDRLAARSTSSLSGELAQAYLSSVCVQRSHPEFDPGIHRSCGRVICQPTARAKWQSFAVVAQAPCRL